ncbi:uncharacterized protein LOC128552371 [Mercenaria mercenaria]|uniref:uncharacterized protein LOC128552371 n=1 Tax=Mercenaria mercenaria TaxID=6596 RepID=UPI00234F15C8|nr:uncharacterized protein LOC128552371 [Mercenaria mercenaria]
MSTQPGTVPYATWAQLPSNPVTGSQSFGCHGNASFVGYANTNTQQTNSDINTFGQYVSSDHLTSRSIQPGTASGMDHNVNTICTTDASVTSAVNVQQPVYPYFSNSGPVMQPTSNVPAHSTQQYMAQPLSEANSHMSGNETFMTSICTDLALHVSQNIKEKCWRGEFIELSSLLEKDVASKQVIKLVNGELQVSSPPSKTNEILSIEKWTDAFLVYMSIMLQKMPYLARDLLQYVNTIRSASKQNSFGWCKYDRMFRQKLYKYTNMKWSFIDAEIWLITMTSHTPVSDKLRPCFDFNDKGYCSKYACQYAHKCKKCSGSHSSVICKNVFQLEQTRGTNYFRPRFPRPVYRQVSNGSSMGPRPYTDRSGALRHVAPRLRP